MKDRGSRGRRTAATDRGPHGPRLRVLLVAPESGARRRLRRLLGCEKGMETEVEGRSVEKAMETVRKREPDLIVVDLDSDWIMGIAFLNILDVRHPHVKVLALSGREEPAVERRILEIGAEGFAGKGLGDAVIRDAIRAVLRGDGAGLPTPAG